MRDRGNARVGGVIATVALAAVALALASCGGGGSGQASCDPTLDPHLTPPGTGAAAFTMGIRINRASDVDEVAADLGDRIKDRDVFVINTEYPHSKPSDWEAALDRLTEKFPCNRTATLTGLSPDPNRPAYEFALVNHSELDAVLVDWEPISWAYAKEGPWSSDLQTNLGRIEEQLKRLAPRLSATNTRMGLVPDYMPRWDYGRTARVVAEANFALDPAHRGYQVIQTQPNCATPGAVGPLIGQLTDQLISQYRGMFGVSLRVGGPKDIPPDMTRELLQHLGFEVAFDQSPNPHAREAVERLGPEQAAACTQAILKAGGAGILYWADAPSIQSMLDTPYGQSVRPSSG